MQDRHHVVSLRRPAVRPQVWLLDLLWLAGWGFSSNSNRPCINGLFEKSYFAKSFCIFNWNNFNKNLESHRLMNVCIKLKSGVHWHGFDSYFRLWIIHTACKDQTDGKKNFAKWNTLKSKPPLLDCSTQLICQAEPHNQPRDQNIATMQRKNVFECWILLSIDRKVSSIFSYSMSFFHTVWEHSRALSRPSKIYQGFLNSIIHKTTNILKSSIEFHAPWTKLSILQKK